MSQAPAAAEKAVPAPAAAPVGSAKMAALVSLCKRRGFIFQASEIYGGINGFWDYGPLGVQLKNNLRDAWWRDMVECPPLGPDGQPLSIVGLDSAIIQNPRAWEASGHVGGFNDLMTDCRETKNRYRADHVLCMQIVNKQTDGTFRFNGYLATIQGEDARDLLRRKAKKLAYKLGTSIGSEIDNNELIPFTSLNADQQKLVIGPDADGPGTLTEPRAFNMMFDTYAGVFRTEDAKVYLRPETAQGIFLNFKNVVDSSRVRIPFGIAQIGKAFRNEITPRNFIFRSREFEQMEMEWFCHPDETEKWYEFWVAERMRWYQSLGVRAENLYRHVIPNDELAHYSVGTSDIEYRWPFTEPEFGELEGVACRGAFDLTQHATFAKTKLDYFDTEQNKAYVPHVVEPAAGLTRGVLLMLCEGYQYDTSRASPEWLKLHPRLAPIKLGIFPLVNKDGMPEVAEKLYADLRRSFICQYDAKQSIGKRYARMDEAGTPFCVTIDGETLTNQTVTIRDRDTASQQRIALSQVQAYVAARLSQA